MNIKNFLKMHPALNYAQDMAEICAPLELLNIVYFSHVHIDKENNFSGLGIVPEFFKLYFEKEYFQFDLHMLKRELPEEYILWDTVKRKKQSYNLHQDFTSFNQGHTFSIILNHDKGKDCYHFATALGNDQMNGEYLQLIDKLKKFISYFKERVASHKELSHAYNLKIPLIKEEGGFLTADSNCNFEQFDSIIQSKRFYSPISNAYLTPREMECLSWFAKGKTIEETALILKLSPRTIKAHMAAVKEKLDCTNQFQLGLSYSQYIS